MRRHVLLATVVPVILVTAPRASARPAPSSERVDLGFVAVAPEDGAPRFVARCGGLTGWFEPGGFLLDARVRAEVPVPGEPIGCRVRLAFAEVAADVTLSGVGPRAGRVHLLRGGDPARWQTALPTFDGLRYRGIQSGVDLQVERRGGRFEYDLLLAPGADPTALRIQVEGADHLAVAPDGALRIATPIGELRQEPPRAFRVGPAGARHAVECSVRLLGDDAFGFAIQAELGGDGLVIDPGISFKTFLGGTGSDVLRGVAPGPAGSIVVAGQTLSLDFPTTTGAYDTTFNGTGFGADDVLVARLAPDGGSLHWATFLGGTDATTFNGEFACAVAVGAAGEVTVAGTTSASDFPVTAGAFQAKRQGTRDAFCTRLSADGAALVWSTYLGGKGVEAAADVALDSTGRVHLTGHTSSQNFPRTPNAFDDELAGPGVLDGFVAVLAGAGDALVYGSFFGGTGDDLGLAVAVDPQGRSHLAGMSESADFPVSAGAFGATSAGEVDVVALKIDPAAPASLFSTYLGGEGTEAGNDLVVGANGDVTIVGGVDDPNFPITPGAHDGTFAGAGEAFVTRLNATGTGLIYSTFLGGSGTGFLDEEAFAVDVNPLGEALVCGRTNSTDFPVAGAGSTGVLAGATDAFVSQLAADGGSLPFSTLLGGSFDEAATAVTIAGAVRAILVGHSSSADFATSPAAYQGEFAGGYSDAFVAGVDLCDGGLVPYGAGCPATGGMTPTLSGAGCPAPGFPLGLTVAGGPPGGLAFFVVGGGQGAVPATGACTLEVGPVAGVFIVPLGASGGLTLSFTVPPGAQPSQANLQVAFADPGAPDGVAATNALAIGVLMPPVVVP